MMKQINMKKSLTLSSLVSASVLVMSCGGKGDQTLPVEQPIVYVVNMPGENLTLLSKVTEGEYRCDEPYGGDNGRNLFFVVHTKGSTASNIYKKDDPFSASMSEKTSGTNQNSAPAYCAATNMMVYSNRYGNHGQRDIYMVSATQGSALTQVTNTPDAEENYPSFSRDGQLIVYEKRHNNSRFVDTEIWIKNLRTNENMMLGHGRHPSFSPDGRSIAYVRYTSDGWSTCLWLMNIDGSNPSQITGSNMGVVWHPRFSPDGSQILFQCSKPEKKDFDLYVVERNGNNLKQLTTNTSYDGDAYWATDGNIYFASDRGGSDGNYQIWRFRFGLRGGTIGGGSGSTYQPMTNGGTQIVPQPSYGTVHEVARGETIKQIADKYGVTIRDIVKWNNLQTMTLKPGMKLKVSGN